MNINDTLLDDTEALHEVGCSPQLIQDMLKAATGTDRQKAASLLIKEVLTENGKQEFWEYVARLAALEGAIRELAPYARDHAVHAVLTYMLGAFLRHRLPSVGMRSRISKLQWKLTGLLHDVGYPAEIANVVLIRQLMAAINRLKTDGRDTDDVVGSKLDFPGLATLAGGRDAFSLLQPWLNSWCVRLDARRHYDSIVDSGGVDHGMISGLAVLQVIDRMYQNNNPKREHLDVLTPDGVNWNEDYFDSDVTPACAAIFLHNLSAATLGLTSVDRDSAPLLFLLKLADSLQDWQRPSKEKPNGDSAEWYDIRVTDTGLVYKAPAANLARISEDIRKSLGADVVTIEPSGE